MLLKEYRTRLRDILQKMNPEEGTVIADLLLAAAMIGCKRKPAGDGDGSSTPATGADGASSGVTVVIEDDSEPELTSSELEQLASEWQTVSATLGFSNASSTNNGGTTNNSGANNGGGNNGGSGNASNNSSTTSGAEESDPYFPGAY